VTQKPALGDTDIVRGALGEEYEILDELGRGGMAIVYRARERGLEREVAVKVLPFPLTFDAGLVERFQREARMAAQLEHPNIVPIYRVGRSGQVIYFVMQYLRGRSLSDVLTERGRLSVAEIRRMLAETGAALGYAARRGVVHRDIKPDNILLDESGRCVVTDFGIARSGADQRLTATGMSLGTPRYMSPEQARAKATDGRSDIYSLGVVAYECLVGHVPFDAEDAVAILLDHVQSPLPRPALQSSEEWELFEIVERMLAKRPEDRFPDGEALLAALGSSTGAPRRTPAPTLPPAYAPPPPRAAGGDDGYDEGRADSSGPQALDRALDRAIDVARPLAAAIRPKARAALDDARRLAERQAPRVEHAWSRTRKGGVRGVLWLRSREPRFWRRALATGALLAAGYWGAHFAIMHRSRCPAPAPRIDSAGSGTPGSPLPFTLMVDEIGRQRGGAEVQLYYDVCGLAENGTFTTDVVLTRRGSALRRLFGGEPAARERFHEKSGGPRERRHRGIDAGELEPGTYELAVTVTDAADRRREKSIVFVVR
jgi:predicted Ser/Thr protein kinase